MHTTLEFQEIGLHKGRLFVHRRVQPCWWLFGRLKFPDYGYVVYGLWHKFCAMAMFLSVQSANETKVVFFFLT